MRYLAMLILLVGCIPQSPEWVALRKGYNTQPTSQDLQLAIQRQCEEMGVPKGSPRYYDCYTHYEQMVIQAMLAGSHTAIPPITDFASPGNIHSPMNPKIACEQDLRGRTVCY